MILVKPCIIALIASLLAAGAPRIAAATVAAAPAAKDPVWGAKVVRALAARADANSLATAAALSFYELSSQHRTSAALVAPVATTPTPASAASALAQAPAHGQVPAPGQAPAGTAATTTALGPPSLAPAPVALPAPAYLDFITRASELAPQDAALSWLRLQLCAATPGCDARDVGTVLRWVDPDNSAAWIWSLATAEKDKDTVEVDRILSDMAEGKRFDVYYNPIMVLMYDALGKVRRELPGAIARSDLARLTALSAVLSAEITPPVPPLVNACREAGNAGGRREDCLRVAKIMQGGDTIIVQMVGFGIERRFLAPDSKETKSLLDRRRLLEWRAAAAAKLDFVVLPWSQRARTRARLAQMRLSRREEDVCIALLQKYGIALEPEENHP